MVLYCVAQLGEWYVSYVGGGSIDVTYVAKAVVGFQKEGVPKVAEGTSDLDATRVEDGGTERGPYGRTKELFGELRCANETMDHPNAFGVLLAECDELVEGANAVYHHGLLKLLGYAYLPLEELQLTCERCAADLVKPAFAHQVGFGEKPFVRRRKGFIRLACLVVGFPGVYTKTARGDDSLRSRSVCMEIDIFHRLCR